MKKLLLLIAFVSVVLQGTSSIWILLSFYMQREYIAENVCINRFDAIPVCMGQCYLQDRLEDNETQDQRLPDVKQKEIHLFLCAGAHYNVKKIVVAFNPVFPSVQAGFTSGAFLRSVFHPPEMV